PRAAAESIARLVGPTVVVKCGAAGAFLRGSAGSTVSVGAPSVTPLDTTGAGDSFNAGFLAGLLRGSTPQEALRLASACGALATTGIGGTAAQPGLAEAAACAAGLTLGG
ncbi:MAG: carbohydrate kinase family protein, partial [Propionibacteriaceae bacterium]|nr:carbohydrate kinase family protein [Propionibacteriaceae bacterium]